MSRTKFNLICAHMYECVCVSIYVHNKVYELLFILREKSSQSYFININKKVHNSSDYRPRAKKIKQTN